MRGHRYKVGHEYSSIECRRRSFSLRVVNSWNSLPDYIVALEFFKSAIHTFLGEKLFEID